MDKKEQHRSYYSLKSIREVCSSPHSKGTEWNNMKKGKKNHQTIDKSIKKNKLLFYIDG